MGGGIVAAGVTFLEDVTTVTEVRGGVVAFCTAAFSAVASNSRNNFSNAAVLTCGIVRFASTFTV